MKNIVKLFSAAVLAGTFMACAQNEEIEPQDTLSGSKLTAVFAPFQFQDGTRAVLVNEDQDLTGFAWEDNDKIRLGYAATFDYICKTGMFPQGAYDDYRTHAIYTISNGGQPTGTFSNTGVKLLPNTNYMAWYPIGDESGRGIQFDLFSQYQSGNGTTDHIGRTCPMYALVATDSNGEPGSATFQQACALFKFVLKLPEGIYTKASLEASYPVNFYVPWTITNFSDFEHKMGNEGIFVATDLYLAQEEGGISVAKGEQLVLYMLVTPQTPYGRGKDAEYIFKLYNADGTFLTTDFTIPLVSQKDSSTSEYAVFAGKGYTLTHTW